MRIYKFTASIFLDALSIQPDFKTMSGLHQAIDDDAFSPTLLKENAGGRLMDRICLKSSDEETYLVLGSKRFDFIYSPDITKKDEDYISLSTFCEQASSKLFKTLSFLERRAHRLALAQSLYLKDLEASEIDKIRDRLMIFPKPFSDSKPFEWDWRCASKLERSFNEKEESINFLATLKRRKKAILIMVGLPEADPALESQYVVEAQGNLFPPEAASPFDEVEFVFDINTSPDNQSARFGGEDVKVFFDKARLWQDELTNNVFTFLEV